MPAAAASGAMVAWCWRARSSVGAISAAWPPASTTLRHGDQRHHGLAGADIALQQPHHAVAAGKVRLDLAERLALRAR